MSIHPFTRMVGSGLLATAIGGGAMTPSQSMPLPVTSVPKIAPAAPTEPVRWRGYGSLLFWQERDGQESARLFALILA